MHLTRRNLLARLAASSGAALLGATSCSTRRATHEPAGREAAELDLADAVRAVRARELSPLELAHSCLERIARLDPQLNSFITVTGEAALEDARRADDEIGRGLWRGPLHGIPIALKDNIDTAGVVTTAASAVFERRVPAEDAEVVRRLKQAGAVLLGKLNMHEFALGTTSAISHFGPVHNPWDLERIAGGSSGGSGAAVAACLCFGAVGTDTGGSIRIPAACCGVAGLKPTHGVVSLHGTIPVSASFDHVGPLCRSAEDTALMLGALTDHPIARECAAGAQLDVSRLRIGVLQTTGQVCDSPVEAEVQAAVDSAVAVIRALVSEVREAQLPVPDLGALIDADSWAFHAEHLASTPELYDPRTRATIMPGRAIGESEVLRLRSELERHRSTIQAAFRSVDLVVLPTLPGLPLRIADAADPFALAACTFAFSLGGWPAISVPCGFSRSGLPIGLLIGGPTYSDARVLALARAYQGVTDWHRRRPVLRLS